MDDRADYRSIMSSSLGADLDVEECEALAAIVNVRTLADGEVFIEEGQTDHALQLLVSGKIRVTHTGPDGKPMVVHVMSPGEYSGVQGFIDGVPRTATLRSVGESVIYNLERGPFESILGSNPKIAYHIMRAVVRNAYNIIENINRQTEHLTNYFFKQGGRF